MLVWESVAYIRVSVPYGEVGRFGTVECSIHLRVVSAAKIAKIGYDLQELSIVYSHVSRDQREVSSSNVYYI